MISLKVHGLRQLDEQLAELAGALAAKTLAAAARKAFMPILEAAREKVNVDTGLLRRSIRLVVQKPVSGDAVVRVGIRFAKVVAIQRGRRKSAEWRWHFIEFGASNHVAFPFLRPAFDENAKRVIEIFKAELAAGIARALKRKAKAAAKAAA
mgnify:FL=1